MTFFIIWRKLARVCDLTTATLDSCITITTPRHTPLSMKKFLVQKHIPAHLQPSHRPVLTPGDRGHIWRGLLIKCLSNNYFIFLTFETNLLFLVVLHRKVISFLWKITGETLVEFSRKIWASLCKMKSTRNRIRLRNSTFLFEIRFIIIIYYQWLSPADHVK